MFRNALRILTSFVVFLFLASCLQAQRPSGGRTGGIIDVQVRYPDGRPGPRGIHVRLEAAEGGAEGDLETVDGGKCRFNESSSGVFIVRIADGGYQEVSARVELIGNPMAYVTLNLIPLKNEEQTHAVTQASLAESVSVKDLSVPQEARQEFGKAEETLRANNADDSIKHLEKAIKIYDAYPEAHQLLGEAYIQKQDWTAAEAALKRSIELEPTLAASYMDLGGLRNQTKNYGGAEEALKKCLELSPDSPAAKYELAKTYWVTGRWQDASPLAEAAVKALPDHASGHVLLANIRLKQRNGAGALHEYQEYLRLEPNGLMAPQVRDMVAKLQKALGQ